MSPRVPRRDQSVIPASGIPDVRVPVDVPSAAFGVPAGGPDISGFGKHVTEIVEREREKADQIAVIDADSQLSGAVVSLLNDPQRGVLTRRGRDVLPAAEGANDSFRRMASEIELGLRSDRQRLMFRRIVASRALDLHAASERHVASELQRYDDEVTDANMANELEIAMVNYRDPARVQQAIEHRRALVVTASQRAGTAPEVTQGRIADATSKVHAGVILHLLNDGDDISAGQYFEAHRDQIVDASRFQLQRVLEEGSTRGESQRRSDAIVANAGSRRQALEQVRAIANPKLRDATQDRIEHFYDEQARVESEERNRFYIRAANALDQDPSRLARDVVPAVVWNRLTPDQRDALENRHERVVNDDRAWLQLLDTPGESLAAMSQSEFESTYWAKLDQPHRERAATLWAQAREQARNPRAEHPDLTITRTVQDRITQTLRDGGYITANKPIGSLSGAQAQIYAHFETEVSRRLEHLELAQKRRATGNEIQQLIDGVLLDKVFVKKDWRHALYDAFNLSLTDWERSYRGFRALLAPSKEQRLRAFLTDDERRRAYVPIEQVPTEYSQEAVNWLRSEGIALDSADSAVLHRFQDRIEAAYSASQTGMPRDQIERILRGQR